MYDAFGNRYIDFVAAQGAISLGYSNPKVIEAVRRQTLKGNSFSLPITLAVETAEMIAAIIPSAEKIRFLKNGDDATTAAIRIARSFTDKPLIYSDGYHGRSDIFTSLTKPASGVFDLHQICQLSDEFYIPVPNSTAAVIIEAAKLSLDDQWRDKVLKLRHFCKEHQILFIVDEIVTGFRVPKWCLSNLWGLDPDIICLGKGIANGWELSVVGGKREIMDCDYFISSTFSDSACALAACKATIEELHQKNFEDLMFYGKRLQEKLNQLHPDIRFEGYGTRAMFNITHPTAALFAQEMCKAGIFLGKAHFYNFAHLKENIESQVISIATSIVDRINRKEVKLEGKLPQETFKR